MARELGEPEIQQGAVIYLLLARPLGRQLGVPGLQVPATPRPFKPAYGSRTEADPGHAAQEPGAGIDGAVATAEKTGLYLQVREPVSGDAQVGDETSTQEKGPLQA